METEAWRSDLQRNEFIRLISLFLFLFSHSFALRAAPSTELGKGSALKPAKTEIVFSIFWTESWKKRALWTRVWRGESYQRGPTILLITSYKGVLSQTQNNTARLWKLNTPKVKPSSHEALSSAHTEHTQSSITRALKDELRLEAPPTEGKTELSTGT